MLGEVMSFAPWFVGAALPQVDILERDRAVLQHDGLLDFPADAIGGLRDGDVERERGVREVAAEALGFDRGEREAVVPHADDVAEHRFVPHVPGAVGRAVVHADREGLPALDELLPARRIHREEVRCGERDVSLELGCRELALEAIDLLEPERDDHVLVGGGSGVALGWASDEHEDEHDFLGGEWAGPA